MKKFLNGYEMIDYGGGSLVSMVIVVALIVLTTAIIIIELVLPHGEWEYDYIDVDGNAGTSSRCVSERGAMTCELDGDHSKVQVKQYRGRKVN